jgi:hypothetical protein
MSSETIRSGSARQGVDNCACHWCGKLLFRRRQAKAVLLHFCDNTCKAEHQRTTKPVSRDWLHQKYVVEGLDCTKIGKLVGRNSKRVYEWLKNLGIPTRPRGLNNRFVKGQANPFKGRKHSPETRARLRAIAKADGRVPFNPAIGSYMKGRKGASHPQWKGGITPERQNFNSTQEWKDAVRAVKARDKHTCQRCGKAKRRCDGEAFDVHHIVPFECKELRAVVSNLVYLCEKCHYWVHGKDNVHKDFIKEA